MPDTALIGGTVYVSPTEEPIRNGVLLIQDQKIAAVGARQDVPIPQGTVAVDCSNRTITAGFWNSHVHFMQRKWSDAAAIPSAELTRQLQEMLTRYGFTTAFDLSSPWDNTRLLRDRIERGEANGPKIYSTGLGLLPLNPGLPPDAALNFMGWMKTAPREIANAEEAAAAARELLDSGVDGIKLFASAPSRSTLSESVIAAAAAEAHRREKPVFVHPNTVDDVRAAIQGGADVVGHTTPHSGPWDDSLFEEVNKRGIALTPTLWIWKWYARHDRAGVQDRIVDAGRQQLGAWIEHGGAVLFGTDLGAVDPDPAPEYALMTEAGMSFRQVLASLTTGPAKRFGKSGELGRLLPGFQADLVVLSGDPSNDIAALTRVQSTMRAGRIIYSG
jgi:imidazolonepropionase-like amidohydrolase